MRMIDADALLKHKDDHEMISTHLIWNAPTVEPKQGKWIRKESWSRGVGMGEVYGWYFECSACGCLSEGSVNDAGNFCPNCGCRMEGADDE